MAGPHVAGAVALLWSADPRLVGNISATRNVQFDTATPMAASKSCGGLPLDAVPNNSSGYGFLDIYHAVHSQLRTQIQ